MLKKQHRLPSFYFKRLYQKGKVIKGSLVTLKMLENKKNVPRFGLIAPASAIRKATKRNLIKRRVGEIINSLLPKIKPGFDYVFIIKREGDFKELKEDLIKLLNA